MNDQTGHMVIKKRRGRAAVESRTGKHTQIADAARELFTDFGYKSVSMDMIAQKAGVAKGTLYLYFKDKETLFTQLVDAMLGDIRAYVESVESKGLSPFQEIHEVVYNLLMLRTRQKFLYRIANEAELLRTPSACTAMRRFSDQIVGYVEVKIENAQRQGLVNACDAKMLAFAMVKVYTALAFEWEDRHEPLNEKRIADFVGMLFRDGLAAAAAPGAPA